MASVFVMFGSLEKNGRIAKRQTEKEQSRDVDWLVDLFVCD